LLLKDPLLDALRGTISEVTPEMAQGWIRNAVRCWCSDAI